MIALLPVLTLLAALGCGLMAGLFFAFSSFVMAALARLPAEQGMAAMNSINVTILNASFSLAFFGSAILCLVLCVIGAMRWGEPGSLWLIVGSLFFLVGTIAVTMIFNVPLNDALVATNPASAEGEALWSHYLAQWLPWNHVRTLSSSAALLAFIFAFARQAV